MSTLEKSVRTTALPGCRTSFTKELPSGAAVKTILKDFFAILFPGYFLYSKKSLPLTHTDLSAAIAETLNSLEEQIFRAICLCSHSEREKFAACQEEAKQTAQAFECELAAARALMISDLEAAYEGDPAAKSHEEVLLSYPGFFATVVYRMAHALYALNVPLLPRMMTEYAHQRTGIDIHPGAEIGRRFFIDHGTGVVIGETSIIGNNVKIYQGVTLGALSIPSAETRHAKQVLKRHPTLHDNVVVYAGATILGGQTVIGQGSVIGGNTWIIQSVAEKSKVMTSANGQKIEVIKEKL